MRGGIEPRAVGRNPSRSRALALLLTVVPVPLSSAAAAQQPDRINIYRFVLDVDVPESPALVALDRAGVGVLRASAPKPVAISVDVPLAGAVSGTAAALDFSPYYLLGGGVRSLSSYRDDAIEGRLKRVATKTLFSLAVATDTATPGATRVGLGVRSTLHDPHDPVLNTELPEQVAERLRAAEAGSLQPTEEEASGRGADLQPLFDAARRAMRAKCCVQVSAGWGLDGVLVGNALAADSLRRVRQTLWLAAQLTLGPRFDVLTTAGARQVFGPGTYGRAGAALQRKGSAADVRAEFLYDGSDRHLHPGLTGELRLLPRSAVVLTAASPAPGRAGPPRLQVDVLVRGYLSERQP